MKRLILSLFGISLFLFTGCLQVNTIISLNPDGSGTVEETVLMGKEMLNMITEFSKSFTEDSTGDVEPFSLFNEEELKTKAADMGDGVTYLSGRKLIKDGNEGYVVTYSFPDVNVLKISQNPSDKVSLDPQMVSDDSDKEEIQFKFTKGSPSTLVIDFPIPKPEAPDSSFESADSSSADSSGYDQIYELMRDLKMELMLKINGNIAESNASFIQGSNITLFSIDFGALLKNKEKLEEFKRINPESFEEVKKLISNIEGIKIELNNPVTIKFN